MENKNSPIFICNRHYKKVLMKSLWEKMWNNAMPTDERIQSIKKDHNYSLPGNNSASQTPVELWKIDELGKKRKSSVQSSDPYHRKPKG